MPRVIVAGSINQDLVIRAPRIPVPGESIIGGDLVYARGGKGANQAVACARLGARAVFIGRVGRDAFGDGLIAGLDENRVDRRFVRRDDLAPSGVAVITLDAAGQNAIVVAPGANARCCAQDVTEEALAGADAVLCQLETPLEFVREALAGGRRARVLTILDAAPASPVPPDVLGLVDLLTCNESEARVLCGLEPDASVDCEDLVRELRGLGPLTLVLKLGEHGALGVRGGERVSVAPPQVQAVDTTGAGDAFTGALAVAMAEGQPLEDALAFAVHAGSLACTVLGAQPSMPTREAVESAIRG